MEPTGAIIVTGIVVVVWAILIFRAIARLETRMDRVERRPVVSTIEPPTVLLPQGTRPRGRETPRDRETLTAPEGTQVKTFHRTNPIWKLEANNWLNYQFDRGARDIRILIEDEEG